MASNNLFLVATVCNERICNALCSVIDRDMKPSARDIEREVFSHHCQADKANVASRFVHKAFQEEVSHAAKENVRAIGGNRSFCYSCKSYRDNRHETTPPLHFTLKTSSRSFRGLPITNPKAGDDRHIRFDTIQYHEANNQFIRQS